MNVSLTRELEELVNEEIKSGQYKSQVKSYVKGCVSYGYAERRSRL